jgi:hypothetical protein
MRIIEEIPNFYKIIALEAFRNTPGVTFDFFPMELVPRIDSINRVIHENSAVSPGPVGDISNPWYMHPHQDDNLLVMSGQRNIDLFTPEHGEIVHFIVEPNKIMRNGEMVYEGPNILVWDKKVFHRIISGSDGSSSINMAFHYKGFDLKNNFNIYDLNFETKEVILLREGYKDQQ